ncbi:MAG: helix-turn-helix domain-containing protein [Armatimonadota bacterium]
MNGYDGQQHAAEAGRVIPGPFYWALNEVADAWREFRYPGPDGRAGRLGEGEFAVYHLLCRWADNTTRQCSRYQTTLADWLNISTKTLRARLRKLIAAGLIRMEQGCVDPQTGEPRPGRYTLLDIEEALRHGRQLSGTLAPVELAAGEPPARRDAPSHPREISSHPGENISYPRENSSHPGEDMTCPREDLTGNKRRQDGKTEKTVSCGRDDTVSSSSLDSLPNALEEAEGRRRFPLTAALAEWCRQTLGRSPFPAEMPAAELEPFEDGLARLDRACQPCGQSAVEALATRLSLRPEVREQFLTARRPHAILARQLNYAVEDFTTRAARLPDAPLRASPAPSAVSAAPGPPMDDEKPEGVSNERWLWTQVDEMCRAERRELARARYQPSGTHDQVPIERPDWIDDQAWELYLQLKSNRPLQPSAGVV